MGLPSGPVGPELEKGVQIYQERRKKNRNGFKKKKTTEIEKEGRNGREKEREKAQLTPLVSPLHSWPQVPACSPGAAEAFLRLLACGVPWGPQEQPTWLPVNLLYVASREVCSS